MLKWRQLCSSIKKVSVRYRLNWRLSRAQVRSGRGREKNACPCHNRVLVAQPVITALQRARNMRIIWNELRSIRNSLWRKWSEKFWYGGLLWTRRWTEVSYHCDFLDELNYSHLDSTEFPQNLLRESEANQENFPQTVGSDSNSGLANVSAKKN
jgi:hypothetical protein